MAKEKGKKSVKPIFYKGFDMKEIKKQGESHPHYNLIAECEKNRGIKIGKE